MKTILIGIVLLWSVQAPPPARTPLASLVGKWTTTVVPEPGNAPVIAPSFAIESKDGKIFVTFERQPQPADATAFVPRGTAPADDISLLLIKYPPAATSTRRIMIRPLGGNQVRCEMYIEFADGRPGLYYAEVFKKSP